MNLWRWWSLTFKNVHFAKIYSSFISSWLPGLCWYLYACQRALRTSEDGLDDKPGALTSNMLSSCPVFFCAPWLSSYWQSNYTVSHRNVSFKNCSEISFQHQRFLLSAKATKISTKRSAEFVLFCLPDCLLWPSYGREKRSQKFCAKLILLSQESFAGISFFFKTL